MRQKTGRKRGRPKGLTPFERRFVAEYLADLNGAAAYRRAGGPSKYAHRAAYDLRIKPDIRVLIAKGEAKAIAAAEMSAAAAVRENWLLCRTRVTQFLDPRSGNLLPAVEWTDDMSAQVASIEVVKRNLIANDGEMEQVIKLKFWNKNQAMELTFKHLRLLEERDPNEGQPDVPAFLIVGKHPRITT